MAAKQAAWTENRCKRVTIDANASSRTAAETAAAGQLAASLPVTPGGLGVVEGSLTIALVAYGGIEASTVAAVLLYRLVSFWLPVPAGWAVLGALSLRRRRAGQVSPLREGPS